MSISVTISAHGQALRSQAHLQFMISDEYCYILAKFSNIVVLEIPQVNSYLISMFADAVSRLDSFGVFVPAV